MLAAKLKRSLVSVQRQLRQMGVGKRRGSEWTPAQIKILRKNYKVTASWELANRLGKTPSDLKRKAAQLRLKK